MNKLEQELQDVQDEADNMANALENPVFSPAFRALIRTRLVALRGRAAELTQRLQAK